MGREKQLRFKLAPPSGQEGNYGLKSAFTGTKLGMATVTTRPH